jgi:hypothetical protein
VFEIKSLITKKLPGKLVLRKGEDNMTKVYRVYNQSFAGIVERRFLTLDDDLK